LLLHRYGDIQTVLTLDYEYGMDLCTQAMEKEREQKAWEIWLSKYPSMDKDTFISFEDYYKGTKTEKQVQPSEEDILQDAQNILNSLKRSM
jgi:hypothetical protein